MEQGKKIDLPQKNLKLGRRESSSALKGRDLDWMFRRFAPQESIGMKDGNWGKALALFYETIHGMSSITNRASNLCENVVALPTGTERLSPHQPPTLLDKTELTE